MRFLLQFVAVVAASFLAGLAVRSVDGNVWLSLSVGVAAAFLTTAVYYGVVRATEKREVTELAGRAAVSGLIRGTLLGVSIFAAVIGVIAAGGGYRIIGLGDDPVNAVGLIGFMAVAVTVEELIFRGVLFRHLEKLTGTWPALAVSALVFGGMHLLNENATLWGALCITISGGGMLTSAYAATRSLWLPIGLHFGWNYAQSAIFGSAVSGNGVQQGLLDSESTGDALVSGGQFGPEASVFTVVAGVLVTTVFLWLAHRRGNLMTRRRNAEPALASTLDR
ncbi:CPBP family intramembrane metalloprotease [Actinoplanes hulinensis]|uniref:CPBP family intramembrane metalloprotease n=1 Tax=Actinoplanes hulinensis TaxID=1144547 RepID=A0ABS7BGN9_9ACTN|nr:CPBP family intramembrane glutamic endopeptidase [Actinoplanes hulinensis]MBW6440059.1 CPBP family intramembrane metalloprotease [Actinoplanes hulinensis]